jgi:hypothetical protein
MLVQRRQPEGQILATTAPARSNRTAMRAARKKKIGQEIESEPFSRWRAKQIEKMKSQTAFPTQVVWYVGTSLFLKVSQLHVSINLTSDLA